MASLLLMIDFCYIILNVYKHTLTRIADARKEIQESSVHLSPHRHLPASTAPERNV